MKITRIAHEANIKKHSSECMYSVSNLHREHFQTHPPIQICKIGKSVHRNGPPLNPFYSMALNLVAQNLPGISMVFFLTFCKNQKHMFFYFRGMKSVKKSIYFFCTKCWKNTRENYRQMTKIWNLPQRPHMCSYPGTAKI